MDMAEGDLNCVYIVDQDQGSIQRLRDLLATEAFELVTFASGDAFERKLAELPAGIVLLSLDLADRGCLDILDLIRATRAELPVIAMRQQPQVKAVVKAMRNGVVDFIEKPVESQALRDALHSCREKYNGAASAGQGGSIQTKLTERQFEVLKLLVAGQQNRRVGATLGISERTVEIHRARIMKQLEVDNFAALVRLATKQGIEP